MCHDRLQEGLDLINTLDDTNDKSLKEIKQKLEIRIN